MYLEQAKIFHRDPTRPVTSVDDDVKEEIALAYSTRVQQQWIF